MTELKPCPFCGDTPVLEQSKTYWNKVVCENCGAEVQTEGCVSWNARPLEDVLQHRIELLEAFVQKIADHYNFTIQADKEDWVCLPSPQEILERYITEAHRLIDELHKEE